MPEEKLAQVFASPVRVRETLSDGSVREYSATRVEADADAVVLDDVEATDGGSGQWLPPVVVKEATKAGTAAAKKAEKEGSDQ